MWPLVAVAVLVLLLVLAVAMYDLTQSEHTVLRNYPVIGHMRFILESLGPELRQYIVASNNEERPFSRDERRWIYASAKDQDTTQTGRVPRAPIARRTPCDRPFVPGAVPQGARRLTRPSSPLAATVVRERVRHELRFALRRSGHRSRPGRRAPGAAAARP